MSDSGIVNLNDYSKSRRTSVSVEHLKLLQESSDMLAAGVTRELSGQAEAMANSLIGLADHSPLAETRDYYFQALSLLNRQSTELFQACTARSPTGFKRERFDTGQTGEIRQKRAQVGLSRKLWGKHISDEQRLRPQPAGVQSRCFDGSES